MIQTFLAVYVQFYGEKHKAVAKTYSNLNVLYSLLNRLEEGENMLLKAIEIAKELPDEQEFLDSLELELKENREKQLSSR